MGFLHQAPAQRTRQQSFLQQICGHDLCIELNNNPASAWAARYERCVDVISLTCRLLCLFEGGCGVHQAIPMLCAGCHIAGKRTSKLALKGHTT